MLIDRNASALARAIAVLGLGALAVGTFLPWLKSGRAHRNSYEASGAIRRLIKPPRAIDTLLSIWPLLAIATAASIALFLVGFGRIATAFAIVTALLGGATAFWAVKSTGNAYASVLIGGPMTTLIGAVLVILAAPLSILPARPAKSHNAIIRSES